VNSRNGDDEKKECAADGAWARLNKLEDAAETTVTKQLHSFEAPFRDAYEAGVIIPALRNKGLAAIDVRPAALFFKRALNDLRAVWLLLTAGYTSQAASVAASLLESALATICLVQSNDNIADFHADPHGEIPWSITKMAKMVVQGEGKKPQTKEFENSWRALYAHYSWLCQIKHSSRRSVMHDTTASTLARKGYVVMALPNVREEDVPVKAMVAIITLQRMLECTEAFAHALGFREKLPNDFRFAERFQAARDSSWRAFEPHLKGLQPIDIAKSRFAKNNPSIE
jgi:hypothetical protein